MAKLTKTEILEWDSCEECPFCKSGYSGDNGYGTGDCYDGKYCENGYFGGVTNYNGFDGRPIYRTDIEVPHCIPPYCQFSEKTWEPMMTLGQLVKEFDDNEIYCLIQYLRDKKLQKQVDEANQNFKFSKMEEIGEPIDPEYIEFAKQTIKHLEEQGYTVLDTFKKSIGGK